MGTVMAAEGVAASSTTPGSPVFSRDAIVPSAGTPPPHRWPPRGRYGRVGAAPAPFDGGASASNGHGVVVAATEEEKEGECSASTIFNGATDKRRLTSALRLRRCETQQHAHNVVAARRGGGAACARKARHWRRRPLWLSSSVASVVSGVAMGGMMGGTWDGELAARVIARDLLRRRRDQVAEGIIQKL